MSSTRYSTNHDPGHAPERNISNSRFTPLRMSLSLAALYARQFAEESRHACLWFVNVAINSERIALCWQRRGLPEPFGCIGRITERRLCELIGLEPAQVYRALTGEDDDDLAAFTTAVRKYRAEFEAKLPPMVKTRETAIVAKCFQAAADGHRMAVLQGKWRHGKSEEVERIWLKNLHRCVLVQVPSNNDERTFIFEMAKALGISTTGGKKPGQIRMNIKNAACPGLLDCFIFDEAHQLWPGDLATAKPVRIEFVRELRDSKGVGSMSVVTDQFALSMELSKLHNDRYAPGQVAGRLDIYTLNEIHTDAEIAAIARLHGGDMEAEALSGFVSLAKSDEGYLGIMVTAINRAREDAGRGNTITREHAIHAIKAEKISDTIKKLAKNATPLRRGRYKIVPLPRNTRRAA